MTLTLQSLLTNEDNPVKICKAIRALVIGALKRDLPNGLYPYQIQVSDSIIERVLRLNGEQLIVCQSRQSGKTESVLVTVLTLSIYFARVLGQHFRVGLFAPAGSQAVLVAKERLKLRYLAAKKLLRSLSLELVTGDAFYSELFVIRNAQNPEDPVDARVRCLSIGESSNITSETFHLIVIEQSEDVDPLKMTEEVFPMAAAVGGVIVLSGNPKHIVKNTYFYDAVTKRADRSGVIQIPWTIAAQYNPRYAAYVQQQKDPVTGIGEKSIAFRTQFNLEWATGYDKFTYFDQMLTLTRKKPLSIPLVDGKPVFDLHAAYDPAKQQDRGVVTFGYAEGEYTHILEWIEFEGEDYTKQCAVIAPRCVELGVKQICVDAAGIGEPVLDILRAELRKIEGGGKVRIKSIHTNDVREANITAKLLQTVWQKALIDYPSLEEAEKKNLRTERSHFVSEFLDLDKVWKGSLMRVQAPNGEDRHDDYPTSCGLLLRSLRSLVKLSIKEVNI